MAVIRIIFLINDFLLVKKISIVSAKQYNKLQTGASVKIAVFLCNSYPAKNVV